MTTFAAAKQEVTFDGKEVTRSISVDDIHAYMVKKGFRFCTRTGARPHGCEMFTMAPVGSFGPETPAVHMFDKYSDGAAGLRINVAQIARCLGRDCGDVLREIAGEAVTLEDAWTALFAALREPGIDDEANVAGRDAWSAVEYGVEWRKIAQGRVLKSKHPNVYMAIVHAAEDLAAIALAEIRAARLTVAP